MYIVLKKVPEYRYPGIPCIMKILNSSCIMQGPPASCCFKAASCSFL